MTSWNGWLSAFLTIRGREIYIRVDNDGSVVGVENRTTSQLMAKDRIKNNIIPSTLGLFDVLSNTENGKKYKDKHSQRTEKPYYISKYGMSPEVVLCV